MAQAVERAKQVTMAELNAIIGVRGLPGLPPTVCITCFHILLLYCFYNKPNVLTSNAVLMLSVAQVCLILLHRFLAGIKLIVCLECYVEQLLLQEVQ